MESPLITLIQGTYKGKSEKYPQKLKLNRDPTFSTSDLYEFIMSLFKNVEPEEFFLFVRKFNMNIAETGTMEMGANIQYHRTLVRGEALCQFDLLSADLKNTDKLYMEYIIKGFIIVPPQVNFKKSARCAAK